MLRKVLVAAAFAGLVGASTPVLAATTQAELRHVEWSFDGPFGKYDQAQLQRGFKVYREVCSSCHSLNMIAFRNLGDPGGPFWNPKYPNSNDNPVVKAIAKDYKIADIDSDSGDAIKREGRTADYFPAPFANDAAAAAANGGAAPPDMSMLVAAREGGPDYVYSIVTGDGVGAPAGLKVAPGKYYDQYYSGDVGAYWHGAGPAPIGGVIGMPPPLTPGRVTFDDGTKSTVDQEAQDVAAFLQWASDPKMEERKTAGAGVMIFLLLFSGILYASYRKIWQSVGH